MENRNCSMPAPAFYTSMMHNFHIISFPLYIVTLNALFRESSQIFSTYKYFIIVHIIINIISECYVSFMMLPMTYLPHPMFRNTGWLADLGFSGMFIFYGLAQSVMLTVGSILEMFFFRYNLISVYKNDLFKKLLRFQVLLYRFLIIIHPIVAITTINYSIGVEAKATMELWLSNPNLPPEVTCYSCIIAVLDDYVMYIITVIYGIQVILQLTVSSCVLFYILNFVKTCQGMSTATIKLQKMMILSLFIQGGIHGLLIMLPTIFLIYALFFKSEMNDLAISLLMCVAYHGFVSTCAMILFTKPLREKILPFKIRIQTQPSNLRGASQDRFSTSRLSSQNRSNNLT
ncbi:Serpentine Receptor, class H [Caenorhabditis elegans]|uniref:Serpentine Receptor, class H n=1 Tax=Caenorhabditis elegans TaxID=6239 RepID=Q23029_CAEEL|nr:Serpentine Receptor, class H [Caenorhabditis elegans]CCD69419.1 Serpentine Receptor, class H [Caenorhabditis elegans]|eukprot:NP_509405.1 Serpentine Receptor, class H [Caenorhabditis elegans]